MSDTTTKDYLATPAAQAADVVLVVEDEPAPAPIEFRDLGEIEFPSGRVRFRDAHVYDSEGVALDIDSGPWTVTVGRGQVGGLGERVLAIELWSPDVRENENADIAEIGRVPIDTATMEIADAETRDSRLAIVTPTGIGDGLYPVMVGRYADGSVECVHVDFTRHVLLDG